jgi:hypothetical protein
MSNTSKYLAEPGWPPNPDNTSVKVTKLTDFYYGRPIMDYQNEDGIHGHRNGPEVTVQHAVAEFIETLNTPINDNASETMLVIAKQMKDEGHEDPFCDNAYEGIVGPLDTVIYCPFDETKGYRTLYTGYHAGIPDIIEPVKEWFYEPYGNERLEAYKAIGMREAQISNLLNTQDDTTDTNLHNLFVEQVRILIDSKYELLREVFSRFGFRLRNHNKFNKYHFPSLDINPLEFLLANGHIFGGKKYKNKKVNIPVIPEKKTRKNKKPKECYKNCESVPSGLCATGCKPSWTSKRKIRSRNWCHCNIDKTKCSIHICRSKTKKKKNKKKYSKNKSRKSK